ncbi:hypothetical protein C1645_827898 [Glomus cerebriforme]|uniref:Uncharacterized protein n=1 Tax=Glomus cerebriforme TaxID=658196 RepID=A0A397SMW4_9GLOM|nr:hypothetical protein C1645_827898 [Glomus cerebriforme]
MSSQASLPASPTSIIEEIFTKIILDVIKDFNTEELIKDEIKILHKKKIAGPDFFNMTKEDFAKDISDEDATGQVDYVIKSLEDLLCITEENSRNIKIRYAQNLA